MDTTHFATVKLTPTKLDTWIKFNMNVMLIGEKGTGKSSQIIDAFNRNNLKWVYFSGATIDPWTDLIGIPKPKKLENGISVIEYIRPENLSDDIEAIFCDEFNRSAKKVKNALMELIQFKSINGRKFPNLKIVWAAINPDDEESNYDVEAIDPAQLDRFQIIVNIPYKADKMFFVKKHGELKGTQAVLWWEQQPENVKLSVSPRRLDYTIEAHTMGLDIHDILPKIANIRMLKEMLGMSPAQIKFNTAYLNADTDVIESLLNDDSSFQELKSFLLSDEKYYINISLLLHNEKLSGLMEESDKFSSWVQKNPNIGKNKEILAEKNKSKTYQNNNSDNKVFKGILDSITNKDELDTRAKVINFCIDNKFSISGKKNGAYSNKNYEKLFTDRFIPLWSNYISQDIISLPLSKAELYTISDFLISINAYITSSKHINLLKAVLIDIIHFYKIYRNLTKQSHPTIMKEDMVSFICVIIHPKLPELVDKAFSINCAGITMEDIDKYIKL